MHAGNSGFANSYRVRQPFTSPPNAPRRRHNRPISRFPRCCILPRRGRRRCAGPGILRCASHGTLARHRSSPTSTSARPRRSSPHPKPRPRSSPRRRIKAGDGRRPDHGRRARSRLLCAGRGLWRKINDKGVTANLLHGERDPDLVSGRHVGFWSSAVESERRTGRSQTLRTTRPSSLAGTGRSD
jgi:hypothetical protein